MDLLNQPLTGEVLQEAFRCSECGKEFKNERNLYFHVRRMHKEPGSCTICNKLFPSAVKMKIHNLKDHPVGPRPQKLPRVWHCHECPKVFASCSNYCKHKKSHEEKPPRRKKDEFKCNVCSKVFSRQWSLRRHMRLKHKTGPNQTRINLRKSSARRPTPLNLTFNCMQCAKQFTVKQKLREHMYKMHRLSRFRCTCCNKLFKQKAHLRRHMKAHHGPGRRRKEFWEVARVTQLARIRKMASTFSMEVNTLPEKDRKRLFQKLVRDDPNLLSKYSDNPLTEEDVIEMIRDANLSDRQLLKVLSVIRRRWGKKAITPNMKKVLRDRKQLLAHLFTVETLDKEDPVHFLGKNDVPITRNLVFCSDLLGLTEARELVEDDEYENVLGIDDGKSLLKVRQSLLELCLVDFPKNLHLRTH